MNTVTEENLLAKKKKLEEIRSENEKLSHEIYTLETQFFALGKNKSIADCSYIHKDFDKNQALKQRLQNLKKSINELMQS